MNSRFCLLKSVEIGNSNSLSLSLIYIVDAGSHASGNITIMGIHQLIKSN